MQEEEPVSMDDDKDMLAFIQVIQVPKKTSDAHFHIRTILPSRRPEVIVTAPLSKPDLFRVPIFNLRLRELMEYPIPLFIQSGIFNDTR